MGVLGTFLDNRGNACALEGSHTPCCMEMAHEKPSWRACPRFGTPDNDSALNCILDACVVFPEECAPENNKEWHGIPLRIWFDAVLKQKP
jgi:hypothetical protein